MGELFSSSSEGFNNVFDLPNLISRVQNGELPTMTSAEVDALDEAIELGIVDEGTLLIPGGEDASA